MKNGSHTLHLREKLWSSALAKISVIGRGRKHPIERILWLTMLHLWLS